MKKTLELGEIYLKGKVYITDPCYNTDIWCMDDRMVKSGNYTCKAVIGNTIETQGWGDRVMELQINHEKYPKNKPNKVIYHSIGVDSGQAGFFDGEYYEKFHNGEYIDDNEEDEAWYKRICDITLNGYNCGIIDGLGVVSESGYGDGCYNLYAGYNSKGEIISLKIRFI